MGLDTKVEQHEAFGMISLVRVSGQTRLFQSEIKHQNWISLTISTASKCRDLSRDWVMPDKELIEVWLSPVQLAEALFNINTTGVPCTLRRYNIEGGVQADITSMPQVDMRKLFEKEVKEQIANSMNRLSKVVEKLDEMIETKSAKRSEIKGLKDDLDTAISHFHSNIPFVEKQFTEAIEDTVMRAKAEIEAYLEEKVRSTGLQALESEAKKMLGNDT